MAENKTDSYNSIVQSTEAEIKIKNSKFISYAIPCQGIDDIQRHLSNLASKHPKRNHLCYAYRLGIGRYQYKTHDDGEPSGTAGRPILGQIDAHGLSDVLVAVVRYFGGILLGPSGLIQAYKEASRNALDCAQYKKVYITSKLEIFCTFEHMDKVFKSVNVFEAKLLAQKHEERAYFLIEIRQSKAQAFVEYLKSLITGYPVSIALVDLPVKDLHIQFLPS